MYGKSNFNTYMGGTFHNINWYKAALQSRVGHLIYYFFNSRIGILIDLATPYRKLSWNERKGVY